MTAWDRLTAELDAWAAAGRIAEFWWRDDDAVDATPALDRLFALRADLDLPLALAVIPAKARPALAGALDGQTGIDILQHGYAHASHRPAGEKKAELGADRELWEIARELSDGRGRMLDLFGETWLDVMVPPWNRIDPPIVNLLPGLGFHGLSAFKARAAIGDPDRLTVVNTHVDIIDWTGTRAASPRHIRPRNGGLPRTCFRCRHDSTQAAPSFLPVADSRLCPGRRGFSGDDIAALECRDNRRGFLGSGGRCFPVCGLRSQYGDTAPWGRRMR